ncbi:hypothetical protein CZ787_09845 [Halomonas citrativorans]|uniref:Uncharacterized protein n=1 Tax=Halomonas citrativorans TaxID=2742612 RepID=A0A1R4I117_9GAMM|nr:hypothetical protein CZ787_09845 [Halomonas citrativorans]
MEALKASICFYLTILLMARQSLLNGCLNIIVTGKRLPLASL